MCTSSLILWESPSMKLPNTFWCGSVRNYKHEVWRLSLWRFQAWFLAGNLLEKSSKNFKKMKGGKFKAWIYKVTFCERFQVWNSTQINAALNRDKKQFHLNVKYWEKLDWKPLNPRPYGRGQGVTFEVDSKHAIRRQFGEWFGWKLLKPKRYGRGQGLMILWKNLNLNYCNFIKDFTWQFRAITLNSLKKIVKVKS